MTMMMKYNETGKHYDDSKYNNYNNMIDDEDNLGNYFHLVFLSA
jgi:hypothetical protein